MENARITFYPIGDADTTLIELRNEKKILFDYANMKSTNDADDTRINLPESLNKVVPGDYDVVCFTHADKDHIFRFSEYFHLDHAVAYQGGSRKKIKELWVPAAVLIEPNLSDDARILRAEARYRLKNKRGIKVFSRPKKLREWCNQQEDISYDEICHLIVDAGSLIPNFNLNTDGIELFVHSPFLSETQHIDRNNAAIVVQATFDDRCQTKLLLGSDINSDTWSDIVKITKYKNNSDRLSWDLFHLSHHCSYTALSQDKGITKTGPIPELKWLFEEKGNYMCRLISPSCPIENIETILPPHYQAANYYKEVANNKNGEFIVTMEYPSRKKPTELTFEINTLNCLILKLEENTEATFVYQRNAERAGNYE